MLPNRFVPLVVVLVGAVITACGTVDESGRGAAAGQDPETPVSSTDTGPTHGTNKPQQGTLAGRVSDAAGRAIAGAWIAPAGLDGQPVPEIGVLTDRRGDYTWSLLPGRYEITVGRQGYATTTKRVAIEAGETTTLDVTLRRSP